MNSPPSVPYQNLIDDPNQGYQQNASSDAEAGVPPPAAAPIRLTYWADVMRNRPQKNSVLAASCIFITAGMSIGFSVGFNQFPGILPNSEHIRACWFIGAIIGSVIGSALVERVTKRLIYFIAIGVASVDGICFTFAPESYSLLTLGRYFGGIAFGIILPAFIMAASEQSVKRFRAMTLGMEHINISVGMLIQAIITCAPNTSNNSNKIHGIIILVYLCGSVLATLICTMESPVYHLRKGNEAEAINVLHSLQKRVVEPNEILNLLAEHKQLLEEDTARGKKTNLILSFKICPKIAVLYILTTLSFSLPIISGLLAASLVDLTNNDQTSIYFFVILRFIGALVGLYTLDILGRRALTAFSLFAGGILLIVFGAMFAENLNILNIDKMQQARVVIIAFQFFAGIVAVASTSYLGEAFPISLKPYFVVVSLCLGCTIQVLLLGTFEITHIDVFAYTVGAIQALFAGYFFLTTPETKGTTLREALAELSKPGIANLS